MSKLSAIPVDKDPQRVAGMFDKVAKNYDLANDLMTLGWDRIWRRAVRKALNPKPGQRILDLAAGTGTSTAYLAQSGAKLVAGDFSHGMIEQGRKKHPNLEFVWADAMDLPFADNEFDAATISFGLRNIADTQKGLSEMARVVRPGGTLLVAEFSRPVFGPARQAYELYLKTFLQGISGLVQDNPEAYTYLAESILQWPDQKKLSQIISECGWENVEYRNLTGGIVALHRATKKS
ncbi:class I SAM-dependent methyltransferase [Actinomycetaceae bacterium TAE3-ERU4]|nr:class I SAM-dependent methyltransferase [Actinomycetaceae bacterium TAE3-ERU4]